MELREYMRIFLKRWWLIVPLALVTLTTSLFVSYAQTPIYETRSTYVTKLDASLTSLPPDSSTADTIIYALDTLTGRQRIFVTYCEVMTSQAIRDKAIAMIGVPTTVDMKPYEVFCSNLPESGVLLLTVQGPSPELATRLNEAIGLAGIERARQLYGYFPIEALDPVTLEEDLVSPNHTQNAVLGAVLGSALGIMLALLIEYLRSPFERMEALSIRHPLYGVYNERYFHQRFEEETNRAHARLRPISVALLRLEPNEDFALLPESVHSTLLRSAALAMEDAARQGDIVAYLKPYTFGILMPETSGDEANALLQRLHNTIRTQTFETSGYVASFTANSGVVATSGGSMGYQATLQKASEALDMATEAGENTIHLLRATPRPFFDDDSVAPADAATGPFGAVGPFDGSDLNAMAWEMPNGEAQGWNLTSNGNTFLPETDERIPSDEVSAETADESDDIPPA